MGFDGIVLFVVMRSSRWALPTMATVRSESATAGVKFAIPPPAHPTYDLLHVIRMALAEDAGDQGMYLALKFFTPQKFHIFLC